MKLLVVLLVFCLGSLTSSTDYKLRKEPSKSLLMFLTLFNGQFTDMKEVKLEIAEYGQTEHDVVNVTLQPVFVPALPNEIVYFLEQSINAVLFRMQILIVREGDLGIISMEPHNFTDVNKYKPGQFDVTKDFDNIRLEDLSPTRPECEGVYMQTDVNVFVGTFPDCHSMVNGEPAKYAVALSCKTLAYLIYWHESKERDSLLPYQYRNVVRYPLLPYVTSGAENFLPPCNCQ